MACFREVDSFPHFESLRYFCHIPSSEGTTSIMRFAHRAEWAELKFETQTCLKFCKWRPAGGTRISHGTGTVRAASTRRITVMEKIIPVTSPIRLQICGYIIIQSETPPRHVAGSMNLTSRVKSRINPKLS